jgi:phosphinothricin acetyltransferase
MIRAIIDNDITAITNIYNFYITNSVATFETEPVTVDDMSQRVTKVHSQDFPWLVAENEEGSIVGYAYASTWKERYAYRFTAEITVYLASNNLQKGIGTQLYSALFSSLQQCNITNVIGCVTLPNKASEVLHEKFGMEKVGHFKKVGYKFGQWLDVGFWQGSLELTK